MTARCRRPECGRPLRTEESVARGYGPVCWQRMHPWVYVPRPVAGDDPDQIPLPLEKHVDPVAALIAERLDEFKALRAVTDEAIVKGGTEPPASYAWQTRDFVEATYLAVLAQVNPDLAEATAAWIKGATEAADGTVPEVVYDWRKQLDAGETLWLPHSIIERL